MLGRKNLSRAEAFARSFVKAPTAPFYMCYGQRAVTKYEHGFARERWNALLDLAGL